MRTATGSPRATPSSAAGGATRALELVLGELVAVTPQVEADHEQDLREEVLEMLIASRGDYVYFGL